MIINIFQKPTEKCPRCLGKGYVDDNDIERLNRVLQWGPGKCAFCYGKGMVNKQTISNISADLSYLTLELPKIERWKLIFGNKSAQKRAEKYQKNLDELIHNISKQYFTDKLDFEAIANLHITKYKIRNVSIKYKEKLIGTIQKIIEYNRNKY